MNGRGFSSSSERADDAEDDTSTTPPTRASPLAPRARLRTASRRVASPPARASFANTLIDRRQIFVWYYISYTDIKTKIYVHITNDIYPKPLARKNVPFKKIIEKAKQPRHIFLTMV